MRKNNLQRINEIIALYLPNRDRYIYLPFIKLATEHWKLVQNSPLEKKRKFIAFLDIILCYLLKYKILLSDPVFTLYLNLSRLRK